MSVAIRLENLTRRFGDVAAVDDLSLEVQQGEVFGFLGPNGAGKTTTIKLITGLLRRDSGRIDVLGADPQTDSLAVRRAIGLVPQDTNIYGDLSAVDNLWHHAALYCDDLSTVGARIDEQLRLMELFDRRLDPAKTYSGGMKRRLALARALLHDPQIIFFDEPTLGVDVQVRHVLWEHVRELRDTQGKTFVVSTNDMAEAEALCDRLVIIDRGRIVALDTPDALRAELGRDIVTLRTRPRIADPDAVFDGLGAAAVKRLEPDGLRLEVEEAERVIGDIVRRVTEDHRLETLQIARPTLDDVFLHHTGRGLRE